MTRITIGNATVQTAIAASTSFAHTAGQGPNEVLYVSVMSYNAACSSVTYGGIALTKIADVNQTQSRTSLWRLESPLGGSNTVAVTLAGASEMVVCARSFSKVGGQVDLDSTGSGGEVASISLTVDGVAGGLVIDAGGKRDDLNENTVPGTGQTEQYDSRVNNNSRGFGGYEEGAASVTMSWSWASVKWATLIAVSLRSSGGGTRMIMMGWKRLLEDLRAGRVPADQIRRRLERAWSI